MQVEWILLDATPEYWSLREGAQQCLEAAQLQGQHPSLLQDWLGAFEVLVEQLTRNDMELAMKLRRFFPDKLQVRYPTMLNIRPP